MGSDPFELIATFFIDDLQLICELSIADRQFPINVAIVNWRSTMLTGNRLR
jgi:hypothetical protein